MPASDIGCTGLIAGLLLLAGCGQKLDWTQSVPVAERQPGIEELPAYPQDGQTVRVNPPGFTWTPSANAKAYRLEVRRATERSLSMVYTQPQSSTVYALPHALKPGEYVWQVIYLDAAGAPAGASNRRSFKVPGGLTPLPMPDVAALKTQLAKLRPRLFLTGHRLAEIKAAVSSGSVPEYQNMMAAADAALLEKPYPEPAGYPSAEFNVDDWRRIYTPAKVGSAHVARTALAYRITGEAKYLEGARRWMLNLASWNPRGCTSHKVRQPNGSQGNDEASMPILDRMALGWDWVGDRLTAQERAQVLASMTERGNQVLELLQRIDFLTHPFSNHEGRVLAFLGNAGLSFLGDIPDAEKWLEYVLRCYLTSYPGWGGDEGGWAQGVSYWSGYVNVLTSFAEALRGATDVDLFRRPFYRNTGYLAVYFQPPYAARGAFGDGSERGANAGQRLILERLADAFDDPILRADAQAIPISQSAASTRGWGEWGVEDVGAVLHAKPGARQRPTQSPAALDGSRYLADIGWAAMHSALGDAANDVWALFKSSRFGSFSHSHADQNTFQLNAYGHALLIDSGYYPWYGSAHDGLWTRQTRAHNGILVNGRGQPVHTWAAGGQIEDYQRQGIITLVRGQAGPAYNLPQTPGIVRLWQKSLHEPVPPLTPKVNTFERTLAFIGSTTRPMLVVHDVLGTDALTEFDWLLHALNRMEADSRTGAIFIRDGDARLVIHLVSTTPVHFSQTDRFNVAPEFEHSATCAAAPRDCAKRFPNQWHLAARTQVPAAEVKFVAVMAPYRATESQPAISVQKTGDIVLFHVADTVVAAWMGRGAKGKLSLDGVAGEARLAVRVAEKGRVDTAAAR